MAQKATLTRLPDKKPTKIIRPKVANDSQKGFPPNSEEINMPPVDVANVGDAGDMTDNNAETPDIDADIPAIDTDIPTIDTDIPTIDTETQPTATQNSDSATTISETISETATNPEHHIQPQEISTNPEHHIQPHNSDYYSKNRIMWDRVKREYIQEYAKCQVRGEKFSPGVFTKARGLPLARVSTISNKEGWINEWKSTLEAAYEKTVEKLLDKGVKQTTITTNKITIPTTLPNGTDLMKETNLLTMDTNKVYNMLSGDTPDLTSRNYWEKLGISEYSSALAKLFAAIAKGLELKRAIRYAGISGKEFSQIRIALPIIEDLYQEAISNYEMSQLMKIEAAGQKDWRSAAYLLESHPELKERYKPQKEAPEVNIVITVDRGRIGGDIVDAEVVKD